MKNVTLVALYGLKPDKLSGLIEECQKRISSVLDNSFQPYSLQQIHATIVGLEREGKSSMLNLNLSRYRSQSEEMDFAGMLHFLRNSGRFPFHVQIGGFRDRNYPFISRVQKPYDRSFSIQGDQVVLMGWPIRGQTLATKTPSSIDLIRESRIYPNTLDEIRQSLQNFNILHGYHRTLTDVDNDFYLRIGMIDQAAIDSVLKQRIEATIKEYLSTLTPVLIEIGTSDTYIASYVDETLPTNSTRVRSISDDTLTPESICELYK